MHVKKVTITLPSNLSNYSNTVKNSAIKQKCICSSLRSELASLYFVSIDVNNCSNFMCLWDRTENKTNRILCPLFHLYIIDCYFFCQFFDIFIEYLAVAFESMDTFVHTHTHTIRLTAKQMNERIPSHCKHCIATFHNFYRLNESKMNLISVN